MTTSSPVKPTNLTGFGVGLGLFIGIVMMALFVLCGTFIDLMTTKSPNDRSFIDMLFAPILSLIVAISFALYGALVGTVPGALMGLVMGAFYQRCRRRLSRPLVLLAGVVTGGAAPCLYLLATGVFQARADALLENVLLILISIGGALFLSHRLNLELGKNVAIAQQFPPHIAA